jgi:hypothetical protein
MNIDLTMPADFDCGNIPPPFLRVAIENEIHRKIGQFRTRNSSGEPVFSLQRSQENTGSPLQTNVSAIIPPKKEMYKPLLRYLDMV